MIFLINLYSTRIGGLNFFLIYIFTTVIVSLSTSLPSSYNDVKKSNTGVYPLSFDLDSGVSNSYTYPSMDVTICFVYILICKHALANAWFNIKMFVSDIAYYSACKLSAKKVAQRKFGGYL